MNFAVSQFVNISNIKCCILELRGDNYKIWKERVILRLDWMNINNVIKKEESQVIIETNTPDVIDLYEK